MAFQGNKKAIKILLFSLLCAGVFLGLTVLTLRVVPPGEPIANRDFEKYVNEITRSFAKQMKEEWGLICYGDGGRMPDDVEEVTLFFRANRRATIEEARVLNVLMTERLVQAINAHERLRPFLHEHPFPVHRVGIDIKFVNAMNSAHSDGSVSHIYHLCPLAPGAPVINRSWLSYNILDGFTGKIIEVYEELYSEAEAIVKASGITEPPLHIVTDKERAVDEIFETFYSEMWEKYGLRIWNIGCKMPEKFEELGVKFTVYHNATQQQARELGVMATERLLEMVNQHEVLRPYLKEYPFPSEKVKMRMNFRNKKGFDFNDGTMESVVLEENELVYHYRPPKEKGELGLKRLAVYDREPYQKALSLTKGLPGL